MKTLREHTLAELEELMLSWNEPKFRAKQVYEWIWDKYTNDIDAMSNLSKSLREKLAAHFALNTVGIDEVQVSSDGTIKSRFKLHDKNFIEGVLIPTEKRATACVSSQVGCSLTCKFCATGYMKRIRNLEAQEIVDEVMLINEQAQKSLGKNLTNIVFMGMGEPLLNYKNVMKAIEQITSPEGMGMSPRRITLSTAGVAKMIRQLGDDQTKVKLALSLHAASDAKRNEIMPINETNNLAAIIEALNYFYKCTKTHVTFEYILFKGFNDSRKDADDLIRIYRQVPCDLINVIEYNPIDNALFEKPDEQATDAFMAYLTANKVNVRLRHSRGKDIDAACGQLANVNLRKLDDQLSAAAKQPSA
ncbi:MAG TPA: 23S rRNA (adenine(2503)-C(2))-methyltransferase RlmN [Chitinophagaceae bacterium]|nr:23S rRNA (adenine(2503)-C(2))-methyltransferase RlmN [Chitinophagaceae bacterium]